MSLMKSPQYRIGFYDGFNNFAPACQSTASMSTSEYLEYRQGLDDGLDEQHELDGFKEDAVDAQERLENTVADLEASLDSTMRDLHDANDEIADLQEALKEAQETIEGLEAAA